MSEPSEMVTAAERLARAIELHALALSESNVSDDEALAVTNDLRARAWTYAQLVVDSTPWGNPFGRLEDEADDGALIANARTPGRRSSKGDVVSLDAHYKVRILNTHESAAFAEAIAREAGISVRDDLEGNNAADIVTALFELDGWEPHSYDSEAIEVVEQSWHCVPD